MTIKQLIKSLQDLADRGHEDQRIAYWHDGHDLQFYVKSVDLGGDCIQITAEPDENKTEGRYI